LSEITAPLVGSTNTPIVVFLPLIAVTGVTGVFFRALAVTVSVALFTSLALALTWTPALSGYLLKEPQAAGSQLPAVGETSHVASASAGSGPPMSDSLLAAE